MLIACWSPKGGSGTSVVAAGLGLVLAQGARGTVIADLAGDIPTVLGLPEPEGPGLADWLAAGPDVPDDALARIELAVRPGLGVLPLGSADLAEEGRGEALAARLAADPRPVVVDCGRARSGARLAVAAGASVSLLVIRPCYLAIRRALAAPIRPSGVVLVAEDGRALGRHDVEQVLGVPVRAEVVCDGAVARAVDAGLLGSRPPRPFVRALRGVLGPP